MNWESCEDQTALDSAIRKGYGAVVRSGFFSVKGSATVRASGSATVQASGSATVQAWGSATVQASGSATVQASGSATVWLSAHAIGTMLSATVRVVARDWATVILRAPAIVDAGSGVVVVDRVVRSVADWGIAYGAAMRDGRMVLYKWVTATGESAHGGPSHETLFYTPQTTVEAPDWDPDPTRECGGGLHACASLRDAEGYKPCTRALAVELWVDPAECRTPQPTDKRPEKIRFRRAYVARVWDPAEMVADNAKELLGGGAIS